MAKQINVESSSLAKIMQNMDMTSQSMMKQLKDLQALLTEVEGGWKGQGARSFHDLQTKIMAEQQKVRRELDRIREAVGETKKDHETNEQEVSAKMRAAEVGGSSGASDGSPNRIASLS